MHACVDPWRATVCVGHNWQWWGWPSVSLVPRSHNQDSPERCRERHFLPHKVGPTVKRMYLHSRLETIWLTKVWEDVKFTWDAENRLQGKFFFSTSNLVQSMVVLASFPDSLHTANNGKLGRAWKWGYDCLCHTHLIMDPPIWIKLSNQRETLPRELLKILDPSFHTWEPWVYEDYGRWL